MDESYWKTDAESIEKMRAAYNESLKKPLTVNKPNPEGYCVNCYSPGDKIARKLETVGELPKHNTLIKLCGHCDGDALELARRNAA